MAKAKRITISLKTRFEVFKRDNFTCYHCGRRPPEAVLEVDHIYPVAEGGTDDYENLRTSCFECNRGKGARLLNDHREIESSHDLLKQSKAELDEFENMLEMRREVARMKAEQKELIINTLEEMSLSTFMKHQRSDAFEAFKKHGFELCAKYVEEYMEDDRQRWNSNRKQYTLSEYIRYQQTRFTLEGRKRYLLAMVRRCTTMTNTRRMAVWLTKAEIRPEYIEELIESFKKLHPFGDSSYVDSDEFVEWWHSMVRPEFGGCCDYHKRRDYYDSDYYHDLIMNETVEATTFDEHRRLSKDHYAGIRDITSLKSVHTGEESSVA